MTNRRDDPEASFSAAGLFDSFATEYERHAADGAYNALYDRPAVLELLGDVNGQRVLDAGCGPGFYANELLSRGANVVGFDSSPEMVRLARQRVGQRLDVRVHNLESPLDWLEEGSFDAALMALVIHHLDDHTAALRELCRVLRPGGRLVVSTHHPTSDWLRLGGSYFAVEPVVRRTGTRRDGTSGTGVSLSRSPAPSSLMPGS